MIIHTHTHTHTYIYIYIYIISFLYFRIWAPKKKRKKKRKRKKELYKAVLYQGEELLREVEIYPEEKEKIEVKEFRISQFSQASERCPPLAVLHTITAIGIKSFKAISPFPSPSQQLECTLADYNI